MLTTIHKRTLESNDMWLNESNARDDKKAAAFYFDVEPKRVRFDGTHEENIKKFKDFASTEKEILITRVSGTQDVTIERYRDIDFQILDTKEWHIDMETLKLAYSYPIVQKNKIMWIEYYDVPPKKFHINLTNFGVEEEDQKNFLVKALKETGLSVEFDDEEFMHLGEDYYNHLGYSLFSNDRNAYVVEPKHLTEYDTRIYVGNEYGWTPVEDWWRDEDDISQNISNQNQDFTLYHRKGKEWFVSPSINHDERTVHFLAEGYEDDTFVIDYEEYETYEYRTEGDKEQEANMIDFIRSSHAHLTAAVVVKSMIESADNSSTPYDMLEYVFGREYYDEILHDFDEEIMKMFLLDPNVSKEVVLSYAKSKYLKNFRRFLKVMLNGNLKITQLHAGKNVKIMCAVSDIGSEYHLSIYDFIGDKKVAPRKLAEMVFEDARKNLEKLDAIEINRKEIKKKMRGLFVSIEDSKNAGNCKIGTISLAKNMGVDILKTGGVLAEEILKFDKTDRAYAAIAEAIKRRDNS